jgi:hypothetical protein
MCLITGTGFTAAAAADFENEGVGAKGPEHAMPREPLGSAAAAVRH